MIFTTKYPNFHFASFTFFSSTYKHNFGRTVARKYLIAGLHVCVRGYSENLNIIHNIAFANCANYYEIIMKYFPANEKKFIKFKSNWVLIIVI